MKKWYPKNYKRTLRRMIKHCPRCRGVGLVQDLKKGHFRDCACCGGTGKVKKDEVTATL